MGACPDPGPGIIGAEWLGSQKPATPDAVSIPWMQASPFAVHGVAPLRPIAFGTDCFDVVQHPVFGAACGFMTKIHEIETVPRSIGLVLQHPDHI